MKQSLRYYSFLALAVAFFTLGLFAFKQQNSYQYLVQEDGLIEYLTAFTLLFLSIFIGIRAIQNKHNYKSLWIVVQLAMAAVFFFGFGEEISWGQRIFNIESNTFFQENNAQSETNLHNLVVGDTKVNKLIFAQGLTLIFGFYFLLFPFIYKRNKPIKQLTNWFAIPVPQLQHVVVLLLFTFPVMFFNADRKWEIWELSLVLILLWLFVDHQLTPNQRNES